MKKLLLTALLTTSLFEISAAAVNTKLEKIEHLFEITDGSEIKNLGPALAPLFAHAHVTDEAIKQQLLTDHTKNVREVYLKTYDTYFSEENIDVMLQYRSSETGKRIQDTTLQIAQEMQSAQLSIMPLAQEIIAAQEKGSIEITTPEAFESDDQVANPKDAKLKKFAGLLHQKTAMTKRMQSQFPILNPKNLAIVVDTYRATLQEATAKTYNKYFTEADVDAMLAYHTSTTGLRVKETEYEVSTEISKTYVGIYTAIQALAPAAQKEVHSAKVVYFDDLIVSKNDEEIKTIFKAEILTNGITVVKFSGNFCPPCKVYAPLFNQVAETLQEVLNEDQEEQPAVPVKYLNIDIQQAEAVAKECSISSIPATILYRNGKKIPTLIGILQPEKLRSLITELGQ